MAANYLEPREWHASLAGVIVAAAALIRDPADRVLCVKPNYRDYWTLPGGICEPGEAPQAGCAREVAEEVGLELPIRQLLAVDWQPAPPEYGPDARPSMYFVFDGGVIDGQREITLQDDELDAYQFAAPDDLAALLAAVGLRRTRAALSVLNSTRTAYLPLQPD